LATSHRCDEGRCSRQGDGVRRLTDASRGAPIQAAEIVKVVTHLD
jgi:hypothetical protein